MAVFATLAQVKAQLDITSARNDGELGQMLAAATEVVESLVGSFDAVTVTERVTVHGGTVLLSRVPTGPVTLEAGTMQIVGFTTNSAAGLLQDVPNLYGYGPLVATYPAGGGAVPAAVTVATAIIVGHLWETQRGSSPGSLSLQEQTVYSDTAFPTRGFAIPNRAKELLEPFLPRVSQIA